MGYRFLNGASWAAHRRGDNVATAVGCSTSATDNYSSCNKHNASTKTTADTSNYSYTAP